MAGLYTKMSVRKDVFGGAFLFSTNHMGAQEIIAEGSKLWPIAKKRGSSLSHKIIRKITSLTHLLCVAGFVKRSLCMQGSNRVFSLQEGTVESVVVLYL